VRPAGEHVVDAEVGRDPYDAQGRIDQHQTVQPVPMLGRVQQADPAACRVPQQVHPVQS
jgi:hypothetical protein